MVCVSPWVPLLLAMVPHCRAHVIKEGVLGRHTTDVHVNLCVISSFVSAGLVLLLNPHNGKEIMSFSPEPGKFSGREVLCVVWPLRPPYPATLALVSGAPDPMQVSRGSVVTCCLCCCVPGSRLEDPFW